MRTKSIVIALLVASLALTAWLIIGSFVTYTPTVSATEVQNAYINRIIRLGSAIGALQAGVIVVILLDGKSDHQSP